MYSYRTWPLFRELKMSSLNNKIALVTGSSRGIGAAIAVRFAQAGARVVVHGRDAAALEAVRAEVDGVSVRGDVTMSADLARMRAEILDRVGPVDVLVANAGSSDSRPGPIE